VEGQDDHAAGSRALPLAIVGLLAVVVVDLVTGGTVLTVVAVTVLAAAAFLLARAQRGLARRARAAVDERDAERVLRHRFELLARVADLLESPLDAPVMLERLSGLFVPDLGDVVVVDLLHEDGTLRGAVTAAVDRSIADDLRTLREEHPISAQSEHPVAVALRTGEPYVLQDLPNQVHGYADSPEHVRHVVGFDYQAVLTVPLIGRRSGFGAISFVRRVGREAFTPDEITLGRIIGARASLALDNARLFADLRATEERLGAIVENLGEAVAAIAPDGTLRFANSAAAEFAGVESADVLVATGGGAALLARWNVFDEAGRPIAPEDYLVVRALAGEEPPPRIQHVVERATGRDRWLMTRAAPVRSDDGAIEFVVWVGEDMTAVKRQEMRERLLSNASKLLGSSLDEDATIDKAAWAVVPELADWARVDLLDERGALEQVAVAHRDIEKVELLHEWRRDFPPPVDHERGPFEVLRSGRSIVWSSVSDADVAAYAQAPRHRELMEAIDTRSMLIVPMIVGEQLIGTMQLATTGESGRMLGERDLDLAEELARRASIAVEHARLHAARTHVATTLQRSLLPPRLPVIPGLTIAARFRAAGTASEVGGDFYDLFEGREGWMVLMGDVTGKGPGAAAITSLARYTMRTVAQYEDDPTVMLERLNATLGSDPERRQICTAVCVEVRSREEGSGASGASGEGEGASGARLRIVCAGHPSPLLVRREGGGVAPVGRPGTLLGAFPEGRWTITDVELRDGDSLVLYTDGVTDTRGPDGGRFGAERLEETLRAIGPVAAEEIAGGIDAALQAFGEQRDDVAVLVLSGTAAGDPKSVVVGSAPEPRAA
jgi:serine phosphatase RsbU (regulator of sigma subunit)/PAS domain-containing protein